MQQALENIAAAMTIACAMGASSWAQTPPPPLAHVEPGLERAVRWKWQAEPGPVSDWGLDLPAAPAALQPGAPIPGIPDRQRPATYTVQRGDALILIGKRFHVPLEILKKVNGLTSNLIRVGDELQIPTPEQVAALTPREPEKAAPQPAAGPAPDDTLTLQVYLDRAGFNAGPIDGEISPGFQQIVQIYVDSHDDLADAATLVEKARRALPSPVAAYTLRREDFRYIAPPKARPAEPAQKSSKKKSGAAPAPKPTYDDLTSTRMLAYRSPWEFVAERFHCSESFLRKLNPSLPDVPPIGSQFRVPGVVPFEIENAFTGPVQPQAPAENPMTASIVDLTRLELRKGEKLLASMPVSIARPGLRGRDSWFILDAIPRPRMISLKEARNPAPPQTRIYGRESPTQATPTPTPAPKEQILPAGPNNPVGLVWVNLAKSPDGAPLPYGLHGTSMPEEMQTYESLGGIRMANWDLLRIIHLLPPGTPLQWTQSPPPRIAPAGT